MDHLKTELFDSDIITDNIDYSIIFFFIFRASDSVVTPTLRAL